MKLFVIVLPCLFVQVVLGKGAGGAGSGAAGGHGGGGGGSSRGDSSRSNVSYYDPLSISAAKSPYYDNWECTADIWKPIQFFNNTCLSTYTNKCDRDFVTTLIYDDLDAANASSYLRTHVNGYWPSLNANRSLAEAETVGNTNWKMDVFDVFYNGTFQLKLVPDQTNSTIVNCPSFTSQTITDAYLRIGPRSRDGIDRGVYDSNSYYLSMGRTFKDPRCPVTANKLFFGLESSSDQTIFGTSWELTSTKNSNALDISGAIKTPRASYNNYFNYLVNSTDQGYIAPSVSARNGTVSCPMWFHQRTLTSRHSPELKATIDASTANLKWTFLDTLAGYRIEGVFSGTISKNGVKLDISSGVIKTTGNSKRFKAPTAKGHILGRFPWLIPVVVLGTLSLIAIIVVACCCHGRRARRKQQIAAETQEWKPKYVA